MAEFPQEWNSFFFELDSFLSRLPAITTEVASKDPKSAPLPEYVGAVANSIQQYAAERTGLAQSRQADDRPSSSHFRHSEHPQSKP